MAAPTSPTVARWELALRLKERRKELGIDVTTITEQLGFSRNYWSAVENERAVLAEEKLLALLSLLRVDQSNFSYYLELRNTAKMRGWWVSYTGRFDPEVERFYGLESGATRIRSFESSVIPGLLQTEEYARAIFEPDPIFGSADIDPLIEIRMQRQKRLRAPDPLHFTVVLSEAALLQRVSDTGVQRRQLQHLANTLEEIPDRLEIRLLPFSTPPGPLIGSSTLLLMDFASDYLPTVAWQEAIRPLGIIDDAHQLRRLTLAFEEGTKRSLGRDATLDEISRIARQMT